MLCVFLLICCSPLTFFRLQQIEEFFGYRDNDDMTWLLSFSYGGSEQNGETTINPMPMLMRERCWFFRWHLTLRLGSFVLCGGERASVSTEASAATKTPPTLLIVGGGGKRASGSPATSAAASTDALLGPSVVCGVVRGLPF